MRPFFNGLPGADAEASSAPPPGSHILARRPAHAFRPGRRGCSPACRRCIGGAGSSCRLLRDSCDEADERAARSIPVPERVGGGHVVEEPPVGSAAQDGVTWKRKRVSAQRCGASWSWRRRSPSADVVSMRGRVVRQRRRRGCSSVPSIGAACAGPACRSSAALRRGSPLPSRRLRSPPLVHHWSAFHSPIAASRSGLLGLHSTPTKPR